ncbi:MAG TPA: rhomboid family intramembrane serine protease [Bacteroidia bacterium]|nr:rhomboid family intramembrane serine protease [Bacteroidia bacterium]
MIITYIIIALTVIVSIYVMENYALKNKMMFNAFQINHQKEWYRFLSNGLIHADYMHLAFNMFSLYMFGRGVEAMYGSPYVFDAKGPLFFILLYVGGLIMSSLYSYEKHKNDIHYNALGASGAVSAVVFAYIALAPTTQLGFMFIPIPIPAYLFGAIFLGIEYFLGRRGHSNIGHDAHFWGAVYGIIFTFILKPSLFSNFISQITGSY